MLSNEDILRAIENKEFEITPFHEDQMRPAGLTFHLGDTLLKPKPGKVIDVKKQELPEYDEIIITDDEPYLLKSGEFLLGQTAEKVTIGDSLGFMIEGRSTGARLGLTVVQTAMIVDTGHTDRAITLELKNNGPNDILLYPNMKIARAVLFRLSKPTSINYDREKGKYRNQKNGGKPILQDEIKEK